MTLEHGVFLVKHIREVCKMSRLYNVDSNVDYVDGQMSDGINHTLKGRLVKKMTH